MAAAPGFKGIVAMEGDEVVGMTYAYTGGPGQWWHEEVRKRIPAAAYRRRLVRSVEVVEVAVSPNHQGKGIGTRLVEVLLEGREEHTAVLSARCDSRAHELYRRLGFEEIARVTFSTAGAPFYIMGANSRPRKRTREGLTPSPQGHPFGRGQARVAARAFRANARAPATAMSPSPPPPRRTHRPPSCRCPWTEPTARRGPRHRPAGARWSVPLPARPTATAVYTVRSFN